MYICISIYMCVYVCHQPIIHVQCHLPCQADTLPHRAP